MLRTLLNLLWTLAVFLSLLWSLNFLLSLLFQLCAYLIHPTNNL